jgi:hypothetical protein
MTLERLKRQDGFVRETVKYFALFVVILIMILDAIAVVQVQMTVRSNASDAAKEAAAKYADGATWAHTHQIAETFVKAKDSRFVDATKSEGSRPEDTVITVIAERSSHTYLYHYFTNLPWGIGERIDNLLNPTAIEDSR